MIAKTPKPPYYAVIFTSIRTDESEKEYIVMAEIMLNLAKQQSGFLGIESARNTVGVTVSYWKDLESIKTWKQQTDHKLAQQIGRTDWYKQYKTRICKVERDYEFEL